MPWQHCRLLCVLVVAASAGCANVSPFGGFWRPQPGASSAGSTRQPPASGAPGTPGSAATAAAGGQPVSDPVALADAIAELQSLGAIDDATRAKLNEDLKRTDPALWPQLLQYFRASIAYRRQLRGENAAELAHSAPPAGGYNYGGDPPTYSGAPAGRSDTSFGYGAPPAIASAAPGEPGRFAAQAALSPPAQYAPSDVRQVSATAPDSVDPSRYAVDPARYAVDTGRYATVIGTSVASSAMNPAAIGSPSAAPGALRPDPAVTALPAVGGGAPAQIATVLPAPVRASTAQGNTAQATAVQAATTKAATAQTNAVPGSVVQATAVQPAAASSVAIVPPAAANAWQTHLDEVIKELEARTTHAPQTAAEINEHARLKLLQLAAGKRDAAVQAIPGIGAAQQDFWSKELYGLSTWLDVERNSDASRRAAEASLHLRQASERLDELAVLHVRNLAFCTEVSSFGVYKKLEPYTFKAGQEVLLYAEVDHFKSESTDRGYHTALKGSYQILDSRGARVAEKEFGLTEEHCQNARRDFFISYFLWMPQKIYGGKYTLQLTIEDTLGQKIGQSSIEFTVKEG